MKILLSFYYIEQYYKIQSSKKLNIDFYRWHNLELAAEYLLNNPNIIEAEWHEVDLNYPN